MRVIANHSLRRPVATVIAIALHGALVALASSAELSDRQWRIEPHRVKLVLAVDLAAATQAGFERRLAHDLGHRLESALAPAWQFEVKLAKRPATRNMCFHAAELTAPPDARLLAGSDKLLLLAVGSEPAGFSLAAREFDATVQRWSAPRSAAIRQSSFLPEGACQLAAQSSAPLARIEIDPSNATRVRLNPRASELGVRLPESCVMLPLVIRLDPRGRRTDSPAAPLPWTYLVVDPHEGEDPSATIVSGMRNPFGARRRGMTELLAIALPTDPAPVPIRLHARRDAAQPLAGFEVFRLEPDGASPTQLGRTGEEGTLTIPAGLTPVTTLLVRTEGQVVAKAPVAVGVAPVLDIPLADDMVRVRAQASVRAIREELVDLVARRAILIARVKGALKRGDGDEARPLMEELANLPIASAFAREIDAAESRAGKSPDPAVDAAIRKQFADVRSLLGKFLDSRPITELQFEVNSAGDSPATDGNEASESSDAQAAS